MATSLNLGNGVGGVGKGALTIIGSLLIEGSNDQGETVNYGLSNANSPCYVEEKDLANGNNTILVPSRAAGVVIMPSTDADFYASLKGISTDSTAFQLNKTAPSLLTFPEFTSVAVTCTNGTDKITETAHGRVAGDRVKVSFAAGGALPAGLSATTIYYLITIGANDYQLSLTPGGAAVDFTTDGTNVLIVPFFSNFVLYWPGRAKLDVPATADAGTDKIAATAHGLSDGDRVKFRALSSTGSVPGGLTAGVLYYVVNKTANDFEVSTTLGGTKIDLTSVGAAFAFSTVDRFKFFWF